MRWPCNVYLGVCRPVIFTTDFWQAATVRALVLGQQTTLQAFTTKQKRHEHQKDLVDTIIPSHIRGVVTIACPEPFASTTAGFSTTCTSLLQDMLNSVSTGCASVFDLAPTRQEFIFVRCVQSSSEPTHLPPTPVPTSERTCHIVLSNTAIDCVRCAQHDVHHARRTAYVAEAVTAVVRTFP